MHTMCPTLALGRSVEVIFPKNYTVYLNYISFDGEGALKTAIAGLRGGGG